MSPESQDLIRQSFAKVVPIAPAAADMFYGRLFALDPSLQGLFSGDMAEQGRKLMAMIGVAVGNLDRLETPATEAAWGELYQTLAAVMTEAAA